MLELPSFGMCKFEFLLRNEPEIVPIVTFKFQYYCQRVNLAESKDERKVRELHKDKGK